MANRPEVRDLLRERGIDIPEDTWFVGGYHDTCSDDVEFFDIDAVPATHAGDLANIQDAFEKLAAAMRTSARAASSRAKPTPRTPSRSAMWKSAANT